MLVGRHAAGDRREQWYDCADECDLARAIVQGDRVTVLHWLRPRTWPAPETLGPAIDGALSALAPLRESMRVDLLLWDAGYELVRRDDAPLRDYDVRAVHALLAGLLEDT